MDEKGCTSAYFAALHAKQAFFDAAVEETLAAAPPSPWLYATPHRYFFMYGAQEVRVARVFTFAVESESRGGWAQLRLIRVQDFFTESAAAVGYPADHVALKHYDPAQHGPGTHTHFSHLWRARRAFTDDGEPTYCLYGAFGTPRGRIRVTPF